MENPSGRKRKINEIEILDESGIVAEEIFFYCKRKVCVSSSVTDRVTSSEAIVSTSTVAEMFPRCKSAICRSQVNILLLNTELLLKDALHKFLSEEMFEAYGNGWVDLSIDMKSLKGLLMGIMEYWKPVFSKCFSAKDKRNIELLLAITNFPDIVDKDICALIFSAVEELIHSIQKRRSHLHVPVEVIRQNQEDCFNVFAMSSEDVTTQSTEEDKNVRELLDDTWTAMNHVCGIIMDHYCIPHDIEYYGRDKRYSEFEVRCLMVELYPSVQTLKKHMCEAVNAVKNCRPVKKLSKTLATTLLEFIPSLKLPIEPKTYPLFTASALERWFTRPKNWQIIELGIMQIQRYFLKLEEALNVMTRLPFRNQPELMEG